MATNAELIAAALAGADTSAPVNVTTASGSTMKSKSGSGVAA